MARRWASLTLAVVGLMLTFEICDDGGVKIAGSTDDLCDLIGWVIVAIKTGHANPTYVSDLSLAEVSIVREEKQE